MKTTHPFNNLIELLRRLPTFGNRSAQKALLYLVENKNVMRELICNMQIVDEKIQKCSTCWNFDTDEVCYICSDKRRDENVICVVQDVNSLWAMEKARAFNGKYHVLGGLLSALQNTTPDSLSMEKLVRRIQLEKFKK